MADLQLPVGEGGIQLAQVLKLAGWAESGGQAKVLIAEGQVLVNGVVEFRKRRQMAVGDRVQVQNGPSLVLIAE